MIRQVFLVITDPGTDEAEIVMHAALTSEAEAQRCAEHINAVREQANPDCPLAQVFEVDLHDSAAAALGLLPPTPAEPA